MQQEKMQARASKPRAPLNRISREQAIADNLMRCAALDLRLLFSHTLPRRSATESLYATAVGDTYYDKQRTAVKNCVVFRPNSCVVLYDMATIPGSIHHRESQLQLSAITLKNLELNCSVTC